MNSFIIDQIEKLLKKSVIKIDFVEIIDESLKHKGHKGSKSGGHILLTLVSSDFENLSKIQRSKLVFKILEFGKDQWLHALSMNLFSPLEWEKKNVSKD